jgi:subtilase family serine protease
VRAWTKRTVAALAAVATATGIGVAGAGAASATDRQTFPGSVPSWAVTANDQGAAAGDATEEAEIYLPLRDPQGAQQLASIVSTPGVASFRHGVTPQQWIARFSPTRSDYQAVLDDLTSQGLTITATPQSRLYVVFRGTAAQLGAAFATSLHEYSFDGQTLLAPSSAPSVPATLAGKVSGIGLDQSKLLTHPTDKPADPDAPSATTHGVQRFAAPQAVINAPCSNYAGEHTATVPAAYGGQTTYPTNICGYKPSQLRSAYGVQSLQQQGINGSGQTVAIIDAYASPTITQDVNTWASAAGEPTLTNGQYTQIVPTPAQFSDQALCQQPSGWQTEQTLDVEAVHGIAPAANVLYVGGYNCGGGLDIALSKVLDGKLANIVSNSYGDGTEALPADVLTGEQNLYLQAAAEGIGLYFSSGDDGDDALLNDGAAQPSFPSSSPWVTAVGGTSVFIDENGRIARETGWGSTRDQIVKNPDGTVAYSQPLPGTFYGGAGGGVSTMFAQPSYQKGIVPASLANGKRVAPDVSADADPYTGYQIGYRPIVDDTSLATGDYVNQTYGGTSLASPLTAAQVALVQQQTHATIGFANPTLYAIDRVLPSAYRDVLPPAGAPLAVADVSPSTGNSYLVTFDRDTSLQTARRYDDVTGIGEVSFTLLNLLAQGRH